MKKNILAALVAAGLLASAAAQAESSYVTVGAGQSQYRFDGVSKNETAVSLAFGQSLGENFGYEVGYVNFGNLGLSETRFGETISVKLRVQSIYAAAVGSLPVSESFSLFAKAGLAINYAKGSSTTTTVSGTESESNTKTKLGPMLGLGLAYNFTKEVAGTVEYRYFHDVAGGGLKASALTGGVRYNF